MEKNERILQGNPGLFEAISMIVSDSDLVRYLEMHGMSYTLGGSTHIVDLDQKDTHIAFLREDHRWRNDGKDGTEWSIVFGVYDTISRTVLSSRSEVVRHWKDQKMDRPNFWWNKIAMGDIVKEVEKRIDCGAWHLGATPYEEEVTELFAILMTEGAKGTGRAVLRLQKPVRLFIRRVPWDEYRAHIKLRSST